MSKHICSYCNGSFVADGKDVNYHHFYIQYDDQRSGLKMQRTVCKECYIKAMRRPIMLQGLIVLFDAALKEEKNIEQNNGD